MIKSALEKLINPLQKSHTPADAVNVGYDSEIIDTIIHSDGRREYINHGHNAMVAEQFLPFLGLCLQGKAKLKYWAIGEGDVAWDGEPAEFTINVKQAFNANGTLKITIGGKTYSITILSTDTVADIQEKITTELKVDFNAYAVETQGVKGISCVARQVGEIEEITLTFNNSTADSTKIDVDPFYSGLDPVEAPIPESVLVTEVVEARKEIAPSLAFPNDGFHFLDDDGEITNTPTNKLEIQLTFGANEGLKHASDYATSHKYVNTAWREFSIVGSHTEGASETLYYINIKRHAVINKTVNESGEGNMIVERKIRFTFNGANQE